MALYSLIVLIVTSLTYYERRQRFVCTWEFDDSRRWWWWYWQWYLMLRWAGC